MNIRKYVTMGLALGALALGLTAVPARAEAVLKGSFELPTAAYWGDTLLQPGQYTIWMSMEMHDVGRVPVIHVSGEGISKTFLSVARPEAESARNALQIADINGTYVVRSFDAGLIGESFAFSVTKSVKDHALRASAGPAIALPVSTGASF
jgi:hypothetical protein